MQGQIVAHVLQAMQLLEPQRGDESQLHIKNAVFIIRSQDKIRICITNGFYDWGLVIFDL